MAARALLLLVSVLVFALPATALADDGGAFETRDRGGFVPGIRLTSGAALHGPRGLTPVTRVSYTFAGAINRRFVLGADLGTTAWWDVKKASFHGDTFAQLFVVKGLFLRGAAGVESLTYVGSSRRAAVGGSLGGGWEFAMGKRGFVSLEADYDVRVRTDRVPVRTVLLGIRLGAYLQKK